MGFSDSLMDRKVVMANMAFSHFFVVSYVNPENEKKRLNTYILLQE